jgi:hypothetical protein
MYRRILLAVALAASGCTPKPKDEMIAADQVPAPAVKAAEQLFPGFKATQVWKLDHDGETVYEFRGKGADGKSHETTISESGKVLWPIQK